MDLSWMAWTLPTAAFVVFIFFSITVMVIWEIKSPGGDPRQPGLFGIDTTRGDRLFISILGSAFISLAWLFFMSTPLWGALVLSATWFFIVFRWV